MDEEAGGTSPILKSSYPCPPSFCSELPNLVSSDTEVFYYTGQDQTYQIPSGAVALKIELWGAGGGTGSSNGRPKGGGAGYTESAIMVPVDASSLKVIVGQKGKISWSSGNTNDTYGGGGGSGNDGGASGGQAGGRSTIRLANGTEILTAGGGGGGGYGSSSYTGGEGGGLVGVDAHISSTGGDGGSQTMGGVQGYGSVHNGEVGVQYQGGRGSITGNGWGGGGGGGGYFGGGGGGGSGGNHGGGGGGSGFVGRDGESLLTGSNYGSVSSFMDITPRRDAVTGIYYANSKTLQGVGDSPAITNGSYGKSDQHGLVKITALKSP